MSWFAPQTNVLFAGTKADSPVVVASSRHVVVTSPGGGWKRIAFGTLFEQIHSRPFLPAVLLFQDFQGKTKG